MTWVVRPGGKGENPKHNVLEEKDVEEEKEKEEEK